uniref:Neuroblast differentiation-associated protein AHNAK-like n=2 Tax=Gadus morhua TaxID=8049 RepID=A0A8C5AYQ8_GADMO
MEHAQAYKVKLCLKRKQEVPEEDPDSHPETIQEEEVTSPEMREQRKTKRPSDARISWPKFPSLGKGRKKSHFRRSHSTSEAEDQTRLELSPTTSDTDTPIKSQEALKGKKKHKVKLNLSKNKGSKSAKADHDTDTLTTAPLNGVNEDPMKEISPPDSPERQVASPPAYLTHQFKIPDSCKLKVEQGMADMAEPESPHHRVELISVDSTLKTADITAALVGQDSPTAHMSPSGKKKKKKEKSELKMKIKGKDKSHKQDVKAKSSPKRLQTLGGSVDVPDPTTNKNLDATKTLPSQVEWPQIAINTDTQLTAGKGFEVISAPKPSQEGKDLQKVEFSYDTSDVGISKISPRIGKEKPKKEAEKLSKGSKQKTDTKRSPFKLPTVGFTDIGMEDIIEKTDVKDKKVSVKIVTEGPKQDPYERLSCPSQRQLPKREEMEIPGMEDASSAGRKKQGTKDPKGLAMIGIEELNAETVQMSIDVKSVKEAVSKLPGFKLPQVDTDGVPIIEEITMIDANAQRITVKTHGTPTKMSDTKTKEGLTLSRTKVQLPNINAANLVSHDIFTETEVEMNKENKEVGDLSSVEMQTKGHKRENILMHGEESRSEETHVQGHATKEDAFEWSSGIYTGQNKANNKDLTSPKKTDKAKSLFTNFGVAKPDIRFPDLDIALPKRNLSTLNVDEGPRRVMAKPTETELERHRTKFKNPSLSCSMPKAIGTEVDLSVSKPDMDITLPEGEVEPSSKVEVKQSQIEPEDKDGERTSATWKMTKFKSRTSGSYTQNITSEEHEMYKKINIEGVELNASIEGPDVDETTHGDMKKAVFGGRTTKIRMPNLGISTPTVKGPDTDFSVSKPDVDITLPKAKADITLSEVKLPSAKVEVKGPEIDTEDFDGSSKFKLSKFKLPKFGTGSSSITAEMPEIDKQIKFDAELNIPKATVDKTAPKVEIEGPSIDLKSTGPDGMGKGSKIKMPSLGLSMPKVKGPDTDFSVSKPEVDITLPKGKAKVNLPEIEVTSTTVQVKGPDIDLKVKDGQGSQATSTNMSVEIPEEKKEIISHGELNIPEARVEITAPKVDIEGPSIDLESTGKGSKFKMPNFGISMPKVKGADIDFGVSRTDVDIMLPKAKADVTLPDVELPSAKVEVKGPEIETEDFDGSSTFKMPKFKLPKFGTGSSSITAKMPEVDKQIKFDAELNIPKATVDIAAPKVDFEGPSIDLKSTGPDGMGKGSKIKMPSLGSMPKVKGPEVDFNSSKTEVDIKLPEDKYEVALPYVELTSTNVEVKGPEIDLKLKDGRSSPSKYKMPSFKFPKFGAASPNISVEIPEVEKEITLDGELIIPEAKVEITAPNVDIEGPSIDLKSTGIDGTGKGGKFKMPNFGISMPKVKGPDIDFSVSKPDVNVTLPKAKADVTLTDVELPSAKVDVKGPEIEAEDFDGSSTFKLPKFKLPKFGTGSSSITAEMPEVDKQIKFDAELNIPKATVDITAPKVEVEGPSIDLKSTGPDGMGKGTKIKMPSLGLSMPKVKGPEEDFNLSKPEVDITLSESKYEVALPDVELTSTIVEVKGPEIDLKLKDGKGSPSKFKMPSFKFPKFGAASPNISVEIPEVEKEITLDGELNIPEAKVEITAPNVDIEGPSIDLKSTGIDGTGKGGKFKMPNLGITMPKVKGPDIDFSVSKPDVDITLPKAKADVTLTDVELPSGKVEVKGPEIETEDFDGSSTFKMPKFKLPKFGTGHSSITAETPEVDKQIKFDAELNIPKATMDITAPKFEVEGPSIDLKSTGTEGMGKGTKFEMPSLGLSMPKVKGPEVDFNVSKPEMDITIPGAKYEVALPDVELTSTKVEVKGPEIDLKLKDGKGSPSKFKMPSFKFPKFGAASPNISVEIPEVEKEITLDRELNIPEAKVEITAPNVDIEGPSIDLKSTGIDSTGKGSKFKMPNLGISMPKVKGPDIDFSVSKPDVNVTLPKAKADVTLTGVELPSAKVEVKVPEIEPEDFDGSSTFKMPKFKLPKFETGSSSITAEMPDVDKQIKFDAELNIPKATVDITAPRVEVEGPSIDLISTGPDGMGKGSKIKMPSLGLSMPKVKGPEVDFNVSKPEMDITIPGAKYEVALPDVELPSTKVEVKGPEIDLKLKDGKGSPSKFKMPSFKFPKFGAASPNISVEIPEVEKEMTIDREMNIPEAKVEITAPKVEIEGPSIDLKSTGIDGTGKGGKFKMPNLGISMPKVKGPEIDFSVSKPDVNITLPKAKADVTLTDVELPSAKVEVEGPEIETADFDGSSTFKMPKFKLPKFGTGHTSITAETPEVDKQIKFDAELNISKATVDITAPKFEVEGPSIDLKSTGTDGMGKGTKFEMPSLGLSMPKVKGPEVDFNVSKPEMDITIPGAKYEVALADVELTSTKVEVKGPEIDLKLKDGKGSPSKFKMPSFKFPKFGAASPNISVEIPEVEKEITLDGELNIPEARVEITAPNVDIEGPSIDLKSTGIDGTGKGSKFKMPNLGISMPKVKGPDIDFSVSKPDVNITLPKADVTLTGVELPSAKVEVKVPEIEPEDFDGSSTFKMPTFKLPKFGTGSSSITAEMPDVDKQIKFDAELNIPKATVDITAPRVEVEGPSIDLISTGPDGMGKGSKIKMPSLGLSMPKVKGPEVDFNVSKPEMDITIPGAKYEVALPDIELPSTQVEVKGPEIDLKLKDGKGSPSKFKMPSFKFPKFGAASPNISVEIPEVEKEITLDRELNIPEAKVEITAPNVEIEGPSIDLKSTGIDGTGKGGKFKMPNLGISMPKVKGPEIDFSVSKPDMNVTLPKAKANVTLTDVELPSAKVEVKGPEIETEDFDGSSTFKMPKFKLPKFGTGSSSITAEMPEVDKQIKFDEELNIPKATVDITAPKVEVEGPSIDLKSTGTDGMGKGSKIKMPSLGLSMPKVKGPEVDFNLSKPEVDLTLPESKYEVALPDVELTSPKVEVKGSEIDLKLKDGKGSPSKFKMPSFKFPKFGAASPKISVEIPEVEKEITLDGELNIPEAKVEITAPIVEIEGPSIDLKSTGIDGTGKGGKFKMPNLGISMPKVKGPEIDFSVSKPDVNVTLPKAKADVTLTDVELPSAKVEVKGPEIETEDFDGSSTFKMPKFKLPKFGTGSSSITAEMPEVDKQIKFDAELNIPKATVDITAPKVEVEGPSIDLKSTGTDGMGKGSKIKMPSLGLSMPKVKGPEVDFNLSKPEVDLTLPESKYEVALPDVELTSPKVEVKGSEIDLKLKDGKGSPSKFKMPSFKFPKFGAASPKISVEIPEVEKEITLDGELNIPEAKVEITAPNVEIEGPSIDLKSTGIDGTGKGGKFKMPNLGISMPKVKGPEIDFSVSKPDVNVTLPKAKADVTLTDVELPSAKVEVKGPEIETEDFDGSSTFKMPKFKLPKFGTGSSSITAEMPEVDKQIKFDAELNIPKATVDITAPKVEVEGPSIDLKSTGTDGMGKGSKIKMPSLGLSMPKVKGPEVDFNLSKPEVDLTLPESKYEVALPDVELTSPKVEVKGSEIDLKLKDGKGSPSKFKMPSFKFPKFGAASPKISVEIPEVEKEITLDGELNIPEAKVEITAPIVEIEGPSIDLKSTGIDGTGKGGKFKMPNLGISMPKVKGPEIDFSVSKPDVNVTLPKAKADVTLTDVELPSAKVEVKGPEIETEDFDGSSTFKMPKFKLPKFGTGSSSITAEMPEVDKQIKFDAELNIPKATVDITAPKVEVEGPSIDLKSTGTDGMGKGSKIKMPSLGLSMPKVKGPEVDFNLSKPEVDLTLPESKYEVALPDVELTSPKVEVKGSEIDLKLKDGKGSPSKFKMPSFKFPKFGAASPKISVEIPEVEKEITFDGELNIPEAKVEITAPIVDIEGPSIDLKSTGIDSTGKGGKFKMPNLGISMPKVKGPEIDFSVSKPDMNVTLPKAEADVTLTDVELPSAKVEVKGPEIETEDFDGSSTFKMPKFKLPKFGTGSSSITAEMPEVDKQIKFDAELNIPRATVDITAPKVEVEGPSIDLKSTGTEGIGKGSKIKMPSLGLSMPKVKGPEVDFNLSKPEVDITLPESKYGVALPDVELTSTEVEVKGSEIDLKLKESKGSPSKFKMPSFKFPKFGAASPNISVEIPEVEKEITFDGELNIPEAKVEITAPIVDIEGPSIDLKSTGIDSTGKGGKFKMPNLGISMPKVKGPEIDFSVSKPDMNVTLPKAKADVTLTDVELPSAKVEVKGPEIETEDFDGSSTFKMPKFKLPKFGTGSSSITAEMPEVDNRIKFDAELNIPKATVDITAPKVEVEGPSIDLKSTRPDGMGKGSKIKMPSLGLSMPKVKGPEVDSNVSKPEMDITIPGAKYEVALPDVELPSTKVEVKGPEIDLKLKDGKGSPSKYKMPSFKFPKFGASSANMSVEIPEVEKEIKLDGELDIPEARVEITAPNVDIEGPSIDVKRTGIDGTGKGSKFKMPNLGISMPKAKGPDIDVSVSKPDVEITLPKAKADVTLPDVELTSTKVEVKGPEIDLKLKDGKGSPSKYKMPSFKLPKFGAASPNISVEIPVVEKEIKLDGELNIPEAKMEITAPNVDIEGPSIDLKSTGIDGTGKGGKFKMPNLGISMPKVKGPDIDFSLSKPDVNITLPKAKADVTLTDVELPSAKLEMKGPEMDTKDFDGSSTFKMPKFKLPKFGTGSSSITAEIPEVDKQIKFDAELNIPKATVDITAPKVEVEGPSIDLKSTGPDGMGKGSKIKMANLGPSMPKVKGPGGDFSVSKPDTEDFDVKSKMPELAVSEVKAFGEPGACAKEDHVSVKQAGWSFPSFSFSKTKDQGINASVESHQIGIRLPDTKKEIHSSDDEGERKKKDFLVEALPSVELETNLKKASSKDHETDANMKELDGFLLRDKMRQMEISEVEGQGSEIEGHFEVTTHSVCIEAPSVNMTKTTGTYLGRKDLEPKEPENVTQPEFDLNLSKRDDFQGKEAEVDKEVGKASATLTALEVCTPEEDVKVKKSWFSLPRFSFSKQSVKETGYKSPEMETKMVLNVAVGSGIETNVLASPIVTEEVEKQDKEIKTWEQTIPLGIKVTSQDKETRDLNAELQTSKPKCQDDIMFPSHDIKTVAPNADSQNPDTVSPVNGSPSKFKLPSFKMPTLSFSKAKPEDEYLPVDTVCKDDQLETKAEPQELVKFIDDESNVSSPEEMERNPPPSNEEISLTNKDVIKSQPKIQNYTLPNPEPVGLFKFPRFGFSTPPGRSPESLDEDLSTAGSIQSSDAFADASSTATSEHTGVSFTSPSKVTVTYSGPDSAVELGALHSTIITSTTRSAQISFEPNLPEMFTILSSGVSSSSVDTLKLESDQIHVIRSNIQATPQVQKSTILTNFNVQSPLEMSKNPEFREATSWFEGAPQEHSGVASVERHITREVSSQEMRTLSRGTVVITQQLTVSGDQVEPIAEDTAGSVKRLRDTVHSEKMRFFEGAHS